MAVSAGKVRKESWMINQDRSTDINLVNATLSALGSRPNQIREIRGMDHDGLLRGDITAQQGKGAR